MSLCVDTKFGLEDPNEANGEEQDMNDVYEYKMAVHETDLAKYLESRQLSHVFPSLCHLHLTCIKNVIVFKDEELNSICDEIRVHGIDRVLLKGALRELQYDYDTFHCLYTNNPSTPPRRKLPASNHANHSQSIANQNMYNQPVQPVDVNAAPLNPEPVAMAAAAGSCEKDKHLAFPMIAVPKQRNVAVAPSEHEQAADIKVEDKVAVPGGDKRRYEALYNDEGDNHKDCPADSEAVCADLRRQVGVLQCQLADILNNPTAEKVDRMHAHRRLPRRAKMQFVRPKQLEQDRKMNAFAVETSCVEDSFTECTVMDSESDRDQRKQTAPMKMNKKQTKKGEKWVQKKHAQKAKKGRSKHTTATRG